MEAQHSGGEAAEPLAQSRNLYANKIAKHYLSTQDETMMANNKHEDQLRKSVDYYDQQNPQHYKRTKYYSPPKARLNSRLPRLTDNEQASSPVRDLTPPRLSHTLMMNNQSQDDLRLPE